MEFEVIQPVPLPPSSPDFSFDSSTSTPYITAPSSPQRFAASSAAYTNYSAVDLSRTSFSINPALWEEDCPGLSGTTPGSPSNFIDFEFEFGGSKSTPFNSSPADELFDHGRIKPLMTVSRPPEQTSKGEPLNVNTAATTSIATGAIPKRVCDILVEEDDVEDDEERPIAPAGSAASTTTSNSKTLSSLISSITNPKGYRKWSFRDFLLFRSASEGRGTSKDPLRKFQALGPKIVRSESVGESTRGLSSRANVAVGEESSIRKQKISKGPHEAYYSANKAVAEEMKRRTALPYKQGLLGGCLGFNPNPGAHDLARGFGSISRG